MELDEVLGFLQVAVFLGLAAIAVRQAVRRRTRAPAYLAGAFAAIGFAILFNRVSPDAGTGALLLGTLSAACLAVYPWLLAAFAWSFAGPLPRPLRLSALLPLLLTVGYVVLAPFPADDDPATTAQTLYIAAFVTSWVVLSAAMAVRLWRVGSRQRLVRARMRLMSSAAILFTLTFFTAVMVPTDSTPLSVTVSLLVLLTAALFAAGFTPPTPLRLWWRRQATHEFQRMQLALIAAITPTETATAVAPLLADLVGGGVVVLDRSGDILTFAHLPREEAERLARRHRTGQPLESRTEALEIGERVLLVRMTPYTPVFGAEEQELVEAFALQMRLAIERADLYQAAEQARQDAEEARRELEGTLVGLAHDLKSPTLAISGFVGLLPHTEDPDERAEMVEHIQASTVYLRQLVDALVEVSRVGHTQTDVDDVDLAETFHAVARRVRGTHPAATVRVEGACPVVRMNPVRVEQMIDNLVGNAVRHGGREDVTVTITCRLHDDGALTIEVADDGRGIDPNDRERIFGLFQRGRSPAAKGSGVGLGMVRRIAQAHGGTLTLGEGDRGARFIILLPPDAVVTEPDPAPAVEPDSARSTAPAPDGGTAPTST